MNEMALNCKQFRISTKGPDDLIQMSAVFLLFSEEKYSVVRAFCSVVQPLTLLSVEGIEYRSNPPSPKSS